MGGALGVAAGPDSVAFSRNPKPKEVKVIVYFPATLICTSLKVYKTKRSLRFDVHRSTDRSTDRSTETSTERSTDTVTLWRMRAER